MMECMLSFIMIDKYIFIKHLFLIKKLLAIFIHSFMFQIKMEFIKAHTGKLCCQITKGMYIIYVQGVPRLVSQVGHTFFRTYVDEPGCPFTC